MMIRPAVLAAALSLASAPLPAQSRPAVWRLDNGHAPVEVREAGARGYAALPVSALVSVGAQVAYAGDTAVVTLGAVEMRFVPGSADVAAGGRTVRLAHAVYDDEGSLYVPAEFFTADLADASGGVLQVSPSERTVHLVATQAQLASAQSAPADAAAAGGAGDAEPGPRAIAVPAAERPMRRLVVVDAGHGGVDPGAHGPDGAREKDVTLRVARRLAEILRQDPTLDVRMTRTTDTLIGLYDRPRMANAWKHDGQPAVFISIHCNANPSHDEKGYETYFLSEARTADARRVESFENAAVQYEESPANAANALGFILTDLRQNHYLRESSDWAQMIQDELRDVHPGPNRGVKQAGFAVLRGTFMPAVLVEIGFISNAREERMLLDAQMQESIARKLAEGVRAYFDRPGARAASD